jgi:hypothetical protein
MVALDTVLFDVHNTSASAIGLTAATAAVGDSATVRNFPQTSTAKLEAVSLQASGSRSARIASPAFHDNVTGLTFNYSEQPSVFQLPQEIGQPLTPGDTLAVSLDAAATSDSLAALLMYYADLGGIQGRFYSWGDIAGIIRSIKAVEVDVTTSATIGAWQDTLLTTTENQLHAGHDYAVLGYDAQTAVVAVAVKGQETGNLRAGGPGPTVSYPTSDYFISMSNLHGTPHIPVFNADNRNSVYVSTAANTASVASKITLVLAELTQRLGS